MTTNYTKVIEFHEAFGLDINDILTDTILENKQLVNLRINLINEEIEELTEAYNNNDFTEVRDAIGDIIYVINGMGVSFGINIDKYYCDVFNLTYKVNSIYENVKKKYTNIKLVNTDNLFNNKYLINRINKIFNKLKNDILHKKKYDIKKYTIHLLEQVYLIGILFNINVDNDFDLIHKSNMSKLCKDENEAIKTVNSYILKYTNNKSPYDTPNYRLSDNKKYYVVYNKSSGKILKSINYSPVDLSI